MMSNSKYADIKCDVIYVGIDNGVTGSIGVIFPDGKSAFVDTPIKRCLSYTKELQYIKRLDWQKFLDGMPVGGGCDVVVWLERPMVNPRAFKATQSALRSLEATIICLEQLEILYYYIDSKVWQKEFFSSAIIGHDDLKKASVEMGVKLFPNHTTKIIKHGDADGILIAEYARRKNGQ